MKFSYLVRMETNEFLFFLEGTRIWVESDYIDILDINIIDNINEINFVNNFDLKFIEELLKEEKIAFIEDFQVYEEYRNQNIGSLCLHQLEDFLRENNINFILLEAKPVNSNDTNLSHLINFYDKNKYEIIEENDSSILMYKEIN